MSCAGGAPPLSARLRPPPSPPLRRVLAGGSCDPRSRPDRRADRDGRGLPGPRRGRAGLPSRVGARGRSASLRSRCRPSSTCSLGVATSKVVAKVASDRRKPGGLTIVLPGREAAFLAPLDVRKLPGVGPRAEQRLAAAGVATVGALAALDDHALRRLLPGKVGTMLRDRARDRPPRVGAFVRTGPDLERGDLRP